MSAEGDPHQAGTGPRTRDDEWMRRAAEAIADGSVLEAIREHAESDETRCLEWCPICRTADLLRANATPELREQWTALQREGLLAFRTLIDHYLNRTEGPAGSALPAGTGHPDRVATPPRGQRPCTVSHLTSPQPPRRIFSHVAVEVDCPSCGTANPERARFCMSCGSRAGLDLRQLRRREPARRQVLHRVREPARARPRPPAAAPAGDGPHPGPRPRGPTWRPPGAPATPPEERRKATVLFADLSGYTAVAERMDPETVKSLVDRALQRLGQEVVRYGGRVDKYIGDNVMAVFGAPVAHEDDPERAVRAGLAMQAAMEEINAEIADTADVSFLLRVGINSGEVLAGQVGDGDYTVIGDPVNVAARLQAAARPGSVTVGEITHRLTARARSSTPSSSRWS